VVNPVPCRGSDRRLTGATTVETTIVVRVDTTSYEREN
jgi:hypothetical protein